MEEKTQVEFDHSTEQEVTDSDATATQSEETTQVEEQANAVTEETVNENQQEEFDELATLQAENEKLNSKVEELENKILRLQADFDNTNRRRNQERLEEQKYRAQNLVTALLPVLDNFERALTHEPTEETRALHSGIEMVYRQLFDALAQEGVEAIAAKGEQFDPNVHQAVMSDSNPDVTTNEITEELQRGYKLKERVIRPSMVKVNQ
ncbi:MAG: nucleotide exchange factor GrpE [Bacilli bacterium]